MQFADPDLSLGRAGDFDLAPWPPASWRSGPAGGSAERYPLKIGRLILPRIESTTKTFAEEHEGPQRVIVGIERSVARALTWCSTASWGTARWQRLLSAVVAIFMLWPQSSFDPTIGFDPSWQAGLALAQAHHLAWGPGLVFNEGPLGFLLNSGYYYYGQSLLASVYQIACISGLFLGITAALRVRNPPLPSLLGAFAATGIAVFFQLGHGLALQSNNSYELLGPELGVLAAFVWASVPLLQQTPTRSKVWTTSVALAAVAGFQLLVKASTCFPTLAFAVALSVLMDWRAAGRHLATLATFAISVALFWFLAGQSLSDLPAWLHYSGEIVSGYVDAMAAIVNPEIVISAAVILGASSAYLVRLSVRGESGVLKRFLAMALLATIFAAKAAFGRFEGWHFGILLAALMVALSISPLRGKQRWVLVVAPLLVLHVFSDLFGMAAVNDRVAALSQAPAQVVERIATLSSPQRFENRAEQAKARQRALYQVPDQFLSAIGDAPVHIDPQETSAAWAYSLNWSPPPVFAPFAIHTPALDELANRSLTHGPRYVLSRLAPSIPAVGVDGRLALQEAPLYSRALLCDYIVLGVDKGWALFAHSTPRCSPLTEVSTTTITENETADIPKPSRPDTAVLVGIELNQSIPDRLFQGALAPLTGFTMELDDAPYRLVTRNAREPFLAVTPSSVAGTNLAIHARTIGIGRVVNLQEPLATAQLHFYEMQVSNPGSAGQPPTTGAPAESRTRSPQSIDRDGTYLVGVDIDPGMYVAPGGPDCSWSLEGAALPPKENRKQFDRPQVVSLSASDTTFETRHCGSWERLR